MVESKLTREEKQILKEYLYSHLYDLSEYHYDLSPKKSWGLDRLLSTYIYWGDEYNDDYITELDCDEDDKISMYVAQRFKEFMAIPIEIRY